ncbi:MAG: ABC transporter permease [Deltaproteobacteria bacterium]|nr:ABC transporter permease [Deltaproteobacteria bacterium]MBI2540201.1 ABC transporter permease [Deltaproteobacteria bacterium]MBI3062276.1 ABC transporter permease [Deltaproteobacteria bacterium]
MAARTQPHWSAKGTGSEDGDALLPLSEGSAEKFTAARSGFAGRLRDFASRSQGFLGLVSFFLAWEIASRTHLLNPFYFPPFSQIVGKGIELFASGVIWEHMIFSLLNFSAGLVTATIAGVLLGIPMGWYKGISRTLDPLLSGIYATPLIALLPLIIMLFGLGAFSKIVMTFLAAVFPVLINTMVGIANTDAHLIKMSRSFGAGDSTIFLKVSLPGSLPYIVAGLRVALGRALVYIVVAEQYGAAMGLGYLSSVAAQRFQIAAMFAPIVMIACLGAALTEVLKAVERRLDKWKPAK